MPQLNLDGLDLGAVRAVLFDLDGTLLDTVPDLEAACREMMLGLGLAPRTSAEIRRFIGKGMDRLVHRCLTGKLDDHADPAQFQQARALFQSAYSQVNGRYAKPYPGVIAGLSAVRALGLPMACVTNKPKIYAEPLLAQTQLAEFFDLIIGGECLPERKPHPLPLLHACERLGVAAQHALMVGDSVHDWEAAHAAGCPAILMRYGYQDALTTRDDVRWAQDFCEISTQLGRWRRS